MIQNRSKLKLSDNSGARLAQCVKVYKTKKPRIGSLILVSIKQTRSQSKLKKGELFKAIIVKLNYKNCRKNGNHVRCFDNSAILLNSKNELYGSRVVGSLTNELRKKKLTKILSLATFII